MSFFLKFNEKNNRKLYGKCYKLNFFCTFAKIIKNIQTYEKVDHHCFSSIRIHACNKL